MSRIIGLGLVASFFFSSLNVLNRLAAMEHGHWIWTAVLRYAYFGVFLAILVSFQRGPKALLEIWRVFTRHWQFLTFLSIFMFGGYVTACFSVCYAPPWVVSATWQVNIVATPFTLAFFGKPVPKRGIIFSVIVFSSAVLANLSRAGQAPLHEIVFYGAIPMFLTGITVPFLWYTVGEARQGNSRRWIPYIPDPVMESTPATMTILILGSTPLMGVSTILGLLVFDMPLEPTNGQLFQTALNALLSGVIALNIYVHVRHGLIGKPYQIAALDAVGGSQILFTLLGEIVLLGGEWPSPLGTAGFLLVILGTACYLFFALPREPASVPTTD